jgi:hypothetical protein
MTPASAGRVRHTFLGSRKTKEHVFADSVSDSHDIAIAPVIKFRAFAKRWIGMRHFGSWPRHNACSCGICGERR